MRKLKRTTRFPTIKPRIDALIEKAGISRRELAKRTGFPRGTITVLICGQQVPTTDEPLKAIARVLGVDDHVALFEEYYEPDEAA